MKIEFNEFIQFVRQELIAVEMGERFDDINNYLIAALPESPYITTWFIDNNVPLDNWIDYSSMNQNAVQLLIIERGEFLFEFLFSTDLMRYDISRLGDTFLLEEYTKPKGDDIITEFLFSYSAGGSANQTLIRKNDNNVVNKYDEFTKVIKSILLKK
ncbi:MAG: hypothetical protein IIB94_00845 [Candidatus Marinimicrobia bacterium]|nr:hypothetical protein [Candidatus Neomarinimicrobiota bacterium]